MSPEQAELEQRCAELARRLTETEKKAAYYQMIAEHAGLKRLRETETLSQLLAEHKRIQAELAKTAANLRQIIDLVPHMVFVKNRAGRFLLVNAAVAKSLGLTVEALTGKLHAEVHPDPAEVAQMLAEDRQVLESGKMLVIPEEPYCDANGQKRWLATIKVPYITADTSEPAILGLAMDITERKQAEEELQRYREHLEELVQARTLTLQQEIVERARAEQQLKLSLQEKEILLKEIHHRVKNNLQVISSLLNLQASFLPDRAMQAVFKESQARVRSMALIHERLYQAADLTQINFHEYVQTLVQELYHAYGASSAQIRLQLDVVEIRFGIDTAIPCGLIVNELVSNALKYAFRAGQGALTISLSEHTAGRHELVISDDGIGLPADFEIDRQRSLGLQLVKGLVEEQLEGTLAWHSEPGKGTRWQICF